MQIKLLKCNNIDYGEVEIKEGQLNVKYGINGTGKSTLSKAIKSKVLNDDSLKDLLQYKALKSDNPEDRPKVEIPPNLSSVAVFDEEYVKSFLFKKMSCFQTAMK